MKPAPFYIQTNNRMNHDDVTSNTYHKSLGKGRRIIHMIGSKVGERSTVNCFHMITWLSQNGWRYESKKGRWAEFGFQSQGNKFDQVSHCKVTMQNGQIAMHVQRCIRQCLYTGNHSTLQRNVHSLQKCYAKWADCYTECTDVLSSFRTKGTTGTLQRNVQSLQKCYTKSEH